MKKYCAISLSLFFILLVACITPSKKDAITVRFAQDPESLHPLNYSNAASLQVLNLLYQSLLSIDLVDKSIQPLLAADLPSIRRDDSLSFFTFTLHPEAKWDNGTPVTAADVAFSLKLLHSPLLDNERWRAQYDFIKDIEYTPSNPTSFTLVCRGYTPEMKLLTGDFFVLPTHTFDPTGVFKGISFATIRQKFDSLSKAPALKEYASFFNKEAFARDTALVRGSGPYKLKSWKSGQMLLLEKKSNWWGSTTQKTSSTLVANPSRIVFQVIEDNAAAVLALKAGQVDVMDEIPLVPFLEMKKNQKYQQGFTFQSPTSYDLVFMGMNGNSPLLEDKKTRQAIAHLLNIPQIIATIQGGLATPTVGFVHPQEKAFYHSGLSPVNYNLEKSKELLTDAGWKQTSEGWVNSRNAGTQKLELQLLYKAGNSDFENIGLLLQQSAKSIGIPINLQAMESSQISDKLQNRNYQLYLRTLAGNPFSYNLLPLFHTDNAVAGGGNVTGFGTPETNQLLEKIATEENDSEKGLLLRKLQEKMQEESNLVFLYFQQNKLAISKKIDSVVVSGIRPGYDLTRFTLRKE